MNITIEMCLLLGSVYYREVFTIERCLLSRGVIEKCLLLRGVYYREVYYRKVFTIERCLLSRGVYYYEVSTIEHMLPSCHDMF